MNDKMPNKTTYLFLVILGFLMGIIWGALSISPYNKLKTAVDNNDAVVAAENAKKIRTYVIIGVVFNVLFVFVRGALSA